MCCDGKRPQHVYSPSFFIDSIFIALKCQRKDVILPLGRVLMGMYNPPHPGEIIREFCIEPLNLRALLKLPEH